MSITLGDHDFANTIIAVVEEHQEIGGRDARVIQLKGVLPPQPTLDAIEAALDAILAAASPDAASVPLVLRPGRVLTVRRTGYTREVQRDARAGRFTLALEAENPFEYAQSPTELPWTLNDSGDTLALTPEGNAEVLPRITLVASAALVEPAFSDGTRTLTCDFTLDPGDTLVFDCAKRTATRNGEDILPYTFGVFPRVPATGTTLTYTEVSGQSPAGAATVHFHDRWW